MSIGAEAAYERCRLSKLAFQEMTVKKSAAALASCQKKQEDCSFDISRINAALNRALLAEADCQRKSGASKVTGNENFNKGIYVATFLIAAIAGVTQNRRN